MKVLIVGASGFVGKNLLHAMPNGWEVFGTFNHDQSFPEFVAKEGLNVCPIKLDLQDKDATKSALKNLGTLDACVFLASYNDVKSMIDFPSLDIQNNILPIINFLDAFRGGKLVFLTSGSVYMGLKGLVTPAVRVDPPLSFTIGRYACEQYVKFYARVKQTLGEFVIVRFFGAYGRYEIPRKLTPRLITQLSEDGNSTFTIVGDGRNYIDLMNVEDTARAIERILQSRHADLVVDLCYGHHMTINSYSKFIAQVLGLDINLQHRGESLEYVRFYASRKMMARKFGFSPEIDLEHGITEYARSLISKRFDR